MPHDDRVAGVPQPAERHSYPAAIVDESAADPAAPPPGPTTPAVVAVVVTHEPGPWFEDGLRALAAQDYPDLTVLVIDAGSAKDPTERVAAACPTAFVRRLDGNPGFVGRRQRGAGDRRGRQLPAALPRRRRPRAPGPWPPSSRRRPGPTPAWSGPKLTEWDDPRQLQAVGMTVDRTGHPSSYVERRGATTRAARHGPRRLLPPRRLPAGAGRPVRHPRRLRRRHALSTARTSTSAGAPTWPAPGWSWPRRPTPATWPTCRPGAPTSTPTA